MASSVAVPLLAFVLAIEAGTLAPIAIFITAVAGAATGIGGFVQGSRAAAQAREQATASAKIAGRSVAREEFDSVVKAQRDMIVDMRVQIAELRVEVEHCETDKLQLHKRVQELEGRT
jgi:hypothetical protein